MTCQSIHRLGYHLAPTGLGVRWARGKLARETPLMDLGERAGRSREATGEKRDLCSFQLNYNPASNLASVTHIKDSRLWCSPLPFRSFNLIIPPLPFDLENLLCIFPGDE